MSSKRSDILTMVYGRPARTRGLDSVPWRAQSACLTETKRQHGVVRPVGLQRVNVRGRVGDVFSRSANVKAGSRISLGLWSRFCSPYLGTTGSRISKPAVQHPLKAGDFGALGSRFPTSGFRLAPPKTTAAEASFRGAKRCGNLTVEPEKRDGHASLPSKELLVQEFNS